MEKYTNLLKGRNRSLLMGFSILWIMAFHLTMFGGLSHILVANLLFGTGYFGVDIFFFLSAYGLCYSFNNNRLKEFYIHRVKRLFPMYLFFLALLFFLFPATRGDSWLSVLFMQITGVATFAKLQIEWFIPALILLYITFPLLYKALEGLYKIDPFIPTVLILIISVLCPILDKVTIHFFPPRLVMALIGIATFLSLRDNNQICLLSLYVICAITGLLTSAVDRYGVILPGSLCIPIILYVLGQLQLPEIKSIQFLGKHTLEIYLAQCIAFNYFMPSSHMSFLITIVLTFISIPLIAISLFYVQKCFNQLWKKTNQVV